MAEAMVFGVPKSQWMDFIGSAKKADAAFYNKSSERFFNGIADLLMDVKPVAGALAAASPGGADVKKKGAAGAQGLASAATAHSPKAGKEMVAAAQQTSKGIIAAKKAEVQGKEAAESGYAAFSGAVNEGVKSGFKQSGQLIGDAFASVVTQIKSGSLDLGETFKSLASAMARGIIMAVGDALIQKGAGKVSEGIAGLIANDSGAGQDIISGAILAAAGGSIKGVGAAFLADGGLVTQPTLSVLGEAGQSEAVIPLDKLSKMKVNSGGLRLRRFEANFSGLGSAAGASPERQTRARSFVQLQSKADRRSGHST